jgi:predicted metal-dependent hydrolase
MPEISNQTVFLEYAGKHISVSLEFKERKRLSISVHPDGSVTAIAPVARSLADVIAHLHRRRSWIARQCRHFEKYQPLPEDKRYVSGETHLYLGRQYRLRVHRSNDVAVKLVGRFLNVYTPTPQDRQAVATALDAWYQAHAEPIFHDRMERCLEAAASLRLTDVQFKIRPMKTRWGSCSKAGKITLNIDLIKMPLHCIEYVIMHELCHLRVHDHSPAFYRLLSRCMPDWERRKQRLDLAVI